MTAPVWLAATTGQATKAGQINQFLGTHAIQYVYQGALATGQTTAGSGSTSTNGQWLAQSFTTGSSQTQVGRVVLSLAVTGTPAPLTVELQSDSAGAPSGTVLASCIVPKEFLTSGATSLSIPLPATVTPSTTYHIVLLKQGDASDSYTWSKSNQTSGAQTSAGGTTWTSQAYGFIFSVYDQSVVQPLAHAVEDSGARWTGLAYTGSNPTTIYEYTAGQTTTGYAASKRTLAYSGGILTGVS